MKKTLPARLALAALAASLLVGCSRAPEAASEGELHIYTWSDYIAPELIEKFQDQYHCTIVIDTFDSNENMYAKLKAGGSGYDLITPTSYLIATMAREGLIVPLDHDQIPNVRANFAQDFKTQLIDDSFTYSAPYAVTYTGFCYDKTKVPADADIATWKILENPAIRGKATLLDDMREVLGGGLMSLGYSLNSRDPAEIDAAVEEILKWKKNIRKFDAESYKTEIPSGATWLGQAYSTDAMQVIEGDEEAGMPPSPDIGFILPREGYSIGFDELVLSAKAPNPALAYQFINFLYEGENAKLNMEYILGPMPVQPGIDALDPDFRDQIILSPDIIAAGQKILPIDDDPAAMALYQKAWDRVKATSVR